ncbi:MAG: APC family permease, partial [Dehalococcoidia bacterium]
MDEHGQSPLSPRPRRRVEAPRPPGPPAEPPPEPAQDAFVAHAPGGIASAPSVESVRIMRPDLVLRELRPGSRPGDAYIRVFTTTAREGSFRWRGRGILQAGIEHTMPKSGWARRAADLRRVLLGRPLATSASHHERLSKATALAVFSSDALSSVAYATQEILLVLVLAGAAALGHLIPISLAIMGLLLVVSVSYRQTIRAYPSGGGSYIVARENLGEMAGLIAGASLMIDYTLTVAVSISAGVAAITSAFHGLEPYAVEIAIAAVVLMVVGNLRGIRESGALFAAPTYIFLVAVLSTIAVGIARAVLGGEAILEAQPPREAVVATSGAGLFLLLRAFASGSTALTGVEAISNGVPAFKAPEWKNAATTLVWMATFLGTMFLGISILAHHYGIVYFADSPETVLSQIASAVYGGKNGFYYAVQLATMAILVLAANTSFADFPRVASILSRDGFMPRAFAFRGDRLAFSNGIMGLGLIAIVLLIGFHAETERLIPLYAVGVFASFTLSQSGMVVHWWRSREGGFRRSMAINGLGAVTTAVVTAIVVATKFSHGAWLSILLTGLLVLAFRRIHGHYQKVARELQLSDLSPPLDVAVAPPVVVVPID